GAAEGGGSAHAGGDGGAAAARGVNEEILREPAKLEDAVADGHRGDALDVERAAETERLAARPELTEAAAGEATGEIATKGFDLRELGHGKARSRARRARRW